jgi:catechol 2,3-dioxygenase-like lactoylglutathione lyase family enzyme
MIAVADVEKSSAWYQRLLGCRSNHGGPYFDRLVNDAGEVLLLLHHWGAEEHPSMRARPAGEQGVGLVLYFRVDDLKAAYRRAMEMKAAVLDEPHYNEQAHQDEFSLRDPDGYFITICHTRD